MGYPPMRLTRLRSRTPASRSCFFPQLSHSGRSSRRGAATRLDTCKTGAEELNSPSEATWMRAPDKLSTLKWLLKLARQAQESRKESRTAPPTAVHGAPSADASFLLRVGARLRRLRCAGI